MTKRPARRPLKDTSERVPNQRVQGVQSIRRVFRIVRLIARFQRQGADLPLIAKESGLSVSTAFRMLKCLTEERLLSYDEEARTYSIGPLAYELGAAAPPAVRAADRWLPTIRRVAAATGLTTYLMTRADLEAVCLAQAQATSPIRAVPLEVGERLPLGMGAGSLAILSSLSSSEMESVIAANFASGAYGSRISETQLRKRVRLTQESGYSVSHGSVVTGIVGIGIVIPMQTEGATLAISVSIAGAPPPEQERNRLAAIIRREIAGGR